LARDNSLDTDFRKCSYFIDFFYLLKFRKVIEYKKEWYFENTSEWTLDYPPFFAYFEKILSKYAAKFDPLLVKIQKDPIATDNVVVFQKMTVVLTDFAILFGAYFFCKVKNPKKCRIYAIFRPSTREKTISRSFF
jgi:hypothetical protein